MMRPMIVQDAGDKHGNKIKWSIPQHKALCSMLCRGFKNQIKYNHQPGDGRRTRPDTRKTQGYVGSHTRGALAPAPWPPRAARAGSRGARCYHPYTCGALTSLQKQNAHTERAPPRARGEGRGRSSVAVGAANDAIAKIGHIKIIRVLPKSRAVCPATSGARVQYSNVRYW